MIQVKIERVEGPSLQELTPVLASWQENHPASCKGPSATGFAFAAKNHSGIVLGMAVAEKKAVKQLRNELYEVRLYILPEWRRQGVARELLKGVFEVFENMDHAPCIGMFCWVTDPVLRQEKNEAIWPLTQMAYLGNSSEGHHLRVRYFKRSVI